MEALFNQLVFLLAINLIVVFLGYWLLGRKLVWPAWLILAASTFSMHVYFLEAHALLRMLALITTAFSAMKVITATQSYRNKPLKLTLAQWLAFAFGWAGMKAEPFESLGAKPVPGAWHLINYGIGRIAKSVMLVLTAHIIHSAGLPSNLEYFLITGLLLVAFSLFLHFGLLSISAGIWRLFGVNTYLLFNSPASATSLTEFWSKRWNLAFSEMTSIALFRPLKHKQGSAFALVAAFLFSGLLHELALSVPVNAGYGLPMLYFLLHGLLVLVEKVMKDRSWFISQSRLIARIWVAFWLIVPLPLLFHYQFIIRVIWPLAGFNF